MRIPKFWFTTETAPPFLGGDFKHFISTVTHDPSRKGFLAKMAGLIAVAGLAPRLLANASLAPAPSTTVSPVKIRPDARAVARRNDSV